MKSINFHLVHKALLLGLFLFPILPLNVSAILLLLNLIVAIGLVIQQLLNRSLSKKKFPIPAIFLISIELLYFIFFLLSDNQNEAWFHFEKKLALIAAPLLFYFLSITKVKIKLNSILKTYVFGGLLLSLISIAVFVFGVISLDITSNNFAYEIRTLNENITQLHPTYLSIHLFSATFISLYLLQIEKAVLKKTFLWIVLTTTVIAGALSGARGPLLAFIISLLFFIMTNNQLSKKWKWLSLLFIVALPFLLIQIPVIGLRIHGLIEAFKFNFGDANTHDSLQRYWVYWCDYGLIKNFWFLGVGSGEVQNHMNLCYQMIDAKMALKNQLNTHNEYANIWIGTGIIGLVLLIGFLASACFHFKTWLPRIFLLIFTLVCMTENLLERQQGVFYAAIFFSLFIFNNLNEQKQSNDSL